MRPDLSPRPYESDACWSNVHHDCDDSLCLCQHHRAQVWDPWDEAWKSAGGTKTSNEEQANG